MSVGRRFGPDGAPRAVLLSVDNLGAASEIERGTWPDGSPPGSHRSLVTALPRLLDELARLGLRATFFVEAVNCELNPQAVDEIAARGHELGMHGWSHEPWDEVPARSEPRLLARATAAFAERGIAVRAFRPPGGAMSGQTCALLRELGYRWCSPAGDGPSCEDGLVVVPFAWELVDAFFLMERFADLRESRDAPRRAESPGQVAQRLLAGLDRGAGVQVIILHPFLMVDDAWWAGARRVLSRLAEMHASGEAWVTSGDELTASLIGAGP